MTIKVFERIVGTPAEVLAIEGMYEAVKAGTLHGLHVFPDNSVVISYEEDQAVSMVVFTEYEETSEIWICFGYCKPEFRRSGHYRACIEKLREIAKSRGYNQIHTATHPDNFAAKASIEERGGRLQYIGYVFPVDA